MCGKQYYGYTLFTVLIVCWLWSIESRNARFPSVDDVVVEQQGDHSQVHFRINNPKDKPFRVATHIRMHALGQKGSNREFASSPVTILTHEIEPLSELMIDQYVQNFAHWSEADVKLYVLDGAPSLEESKLDKLGNFSLNSLQKFFE